MGWPRSGGGGTDEAGGGEDSGGACTVVAGDSVAGDWMTAAGEEVDPETASLCSDPATGAAAVTRRRLGALLV